MVKGEEKVYKLFCFLKKKAIGLLKEGKTVLETEASLMDYLKSFGFLKENKKEVDDKLSHRSLTAKSAKKYAMEAQRNPQSSFAHSFAPALRALRALRLIPSSPLIDSS